MVLRRFLSFYSPFLSVLLGSLYLNIYIRCKDSIKGGDYKMKMFFLLKNNARRGMGGKGVLKKGEEKGQKKASKIREF